MPRKRMVEGPIGTGWVEAVKTAGGTRWMAKWKKYVADSSAPGGRRRVHGGSHDLGPKVKTGPEGALKSKTDAMKAWLKICDSIMGREAAVPEALQADRSFEWYWKNVYRPHKEPGWGEHTKGVVGSIVEKRLLGAFGDTPLRAMNHADMQMFLNDLAKHASESTVQKCRNYLRGALRKAWEDGVLPKFLAANIKVPKETRRPNRPWVTVEDFRKIVAHVPTERDVIILELLYLGALRRGELFALRWQDFDAGRNTLMVQWQVDRDGANLTYAKTDQSIAPVVIPTELSRKLAEWHKWCPDGAPDAFMFARPSGMPLHPLRWMRGVLFPACKAAGVPQVTFHAFRRGIATEGHLAGVGDKALQAQLRHASVTLTQDTYMQHVPAAQPEAVERLAQHVAGRKAQPGKKRKRAAKARTRARARAAATPKKVRPTGATEDSGTNQRRLFLVDLDSRQPARVPSPDGAHDPAAQR